ncbi:MAG: hypothetical protein LQ351_002976 [Letrouitia transgressa]|nr:MAG: hypothetical protein LQ351_002976 [Letrouitia transgressa]
MKEDFQAIYDGEKTYLFVPALLNEVSYEQFESIKTPFNQCIERVLTHISLDEHFITFYEWCMSVSVPIVILSGGLTPIIQALLTKSIGHELRGIEIVANSVVVQNKFRSVDDEGGAWRVQFHDDSVFGHDKASTIRQYAKHREGMPEHEKPILLYAGDGVSDISAAKEADLLSAKQGEGLENYCKQQNIPFTKFKIWKDILEITKDL